MTPYIDKESRVFWDAKMTNLLDVIDSDVEAGKINYIITKLLQKWIKNKLRYVSICLVCGTLICVLLEFYRRVAAPYEDKKIDEEGDVFE